jgi:acyl-coenzyme A thioesterase PaaI-like protein
MDERARGGTKQPNSRHCFVCGVENESGLAVAFYEVEGADGGLEVEARFTPRSEHQGYPGRMHGGLVTGVLDEAIGRAINAGSGSGEAMSWGVAAELSVRFLKPVPLGVELVARGRITRDRRRLFEGAGELLLPDGTVAVSASGRFIRMDLGDISEGVDPDELGWRVYPD